jgi:hypothetical protein
MDDGCQKQGCDPISRKKYCNAKCRNQIYPGYILERLGLIIDYDEGEYDMNDRDRSATAVRRLRSIAAAVATPLSPLIFVDV